MFLNRLNVVAEPTAEIVPNDANDVPLDFDHVKTIEKHVTGAFPRP